MGGGSRGQEFERDLGAGEGALGISGTTLKWMGTLRVCIAKRGWAETQTQGSSM